MKIYLYPVIIGGFTLTVILQGVLFASSGLQSQHLQKQLDEVNQKLSDLQTLTNNEVVPGITKITTKNTTQVLQPTSDNLTGSTNSDPNDLLSPENLSKTLGAATGTGTKGIKLKSNWTSVDVYESKQASSRIIGRIDANNTYLIISKNQDWYQIKLDAQTNAWVQAQFVNETI